MSAISLKAQILEKGYNLDAIEDVTVKTFQNAIGGIAKAAHSEWVRLAQEKLSTSRADYIHGLRQAESFRMTSSGGSTVFEIQLVGKMANNYEHGMAGFDMKSVRPGWLGGGKAITAKEGHSYIRIPFRHSKSSDARLGYSGKAKRADLGRLLKETTSAFGMNRMVRTSGGKVVTGPVARVPNNASGVHPYLRGLTKIQSKAGGSPVTLAGGKKAERGSSTLVTWRVMSEKSPAGSWKHPGLDGANLMPLVESWIKREVNSVIDKILG